MAEKLNEQPQLTPADHIKKEPTSYELLETFLEQQKVLIEKFDAVLEKPADKKKDKWDVLASLSGLFTFLSSVVIAVVGIYFTNTYKMQDVRITEAQTVEKFLPFLNSPENRKGALLAVYALQDYELAARLAASYAAPDNLDACELILKTAQGETREQLIDAIVEALKTRAEIEGGNNNSRVDREELIGNYKRIFELRKDKEILNKRGQWYLASIYTGRGNIYRDLRKYKEALDDYKKSLEIYPDFAWTFEHIGIMYNMQNDFENAILNLNKAITMQPGFGDYYADLGNVYAKKADSEEDLEAKDKDLESAEAQYTQAIVKEPGNISLHFARAYFFLDHEINDKAEESFDDIRSLSKNDVDQTEALYQLRKLNPQYLKKNVAEEETQAEELRSVPKAVPDGQAPPDFKAPPKPKPTPTPKRKATRRRR